MAGGGAMIAPVIGMMTDAITRQNQKKDAQQNAQQQYENQRKLNEQGQQLGMKTWEETNYLPQRQQMEKAGLNVGMMYGMSGGGGQTTSTPSGGSASQAPTIAPQGGAIAGIGMMKELALMDAQRENIEADTANKKAEVPVKGADVALKGSQKGNLDIDTSFKQNTLDDRQLQEQAKAVGGFIENTNKEADTQVKKAQIEKMSTDIAQGWEKLSQGQQEIAIRKFEAELKAMYPSESQVIGGTMNEMVRMIKQKLGLPDQHKKQ